MTASLETFAKVRALHDRTTNPGEKAAAANRMEALARSAGMTVKQAMSKLDKPKAKPKPAPKTQAQAAADAFSSFFNSPEMQAAAAQREAKRRVRAAAAIAKHGSEEAVFADTPREAALRAACAHIVETRPGPDWEGWYRLAGWDAFDGKDAMPAPVREAARQGWPLPETVAGVWAEYEAGEELDDERCALNGGDYNPHLWVEARRWILEELLDSLPARSMRDLRARLAWMHYILNRGFRRPVEKDQACLDVLRGDVDRMGERIRAAEHGADMRSPDPEGSSLVQTGHHAPEPKSQLRQDNPDPDRAADAVLRPSRETSPGCEAGPDRLKPQPVQSGRGQGSAQPATPLRRTNAEKRRAVLDLLRANADDPGIALSDREIARRAGVSPQTVGNIRRAQP